MEKGGLLLRVPVDYDARLKKIVLTRYAESIRNQIQAQIRVTEAAMTEGFTEEELAAFLSYVTRFKKNLEKCE